MKFEDFVKGRRQIGIKRYGEHSHKDLSHNDLIQMAQEELGDFVWYIKWLKERGTDFTSYIRYIEAIYDRLELRRK